MQKLALVLFLWLSLTASRTYADVTLGVTSPAVRFSPGNWAGVVGGGGPIGRRTWNNGAWCEWHWTTSSDRPSATLQITNPTGGSFVSYFLDGALVENVPVPAQGGIPITGLAGRGDHTLVVYPCNSAQTARWDGTNAYTVTGLTADGGAAPLPASPPRPWVMIVGDSITEGIGAGSSLGDYAFLVGQGLRARGYDTGVSACGYSGWIRPGDGGGDVPGYYAVHHGVYSEAKSRWNKIDAYTSLLDAKGHLSGHGGTGQEPAAILFNYMVNEALSGADLKDAQASVAGCLAALRRAAPQTWLLVLVPPGLYDAGVYPHGTPYIAALKAGVGDYRKAHPADRRTVLVDLGPAVARSLASGPYGAGVHPNTAGHAFLAPLVLQALLQYLH